MAITAVALYCMLVSHTYLIHMCYSGISSNYMRSIGLVEPEEFGVKHIGDLLSFLCVQENI